MNTRLLILVLAICYIGTQQTIGQARKYSYQQIGEENGLSQNFVYGLIQDDRGFLWAGTGAGLSRYDGYEINNFTTRDSLSGDFVTAAFRASSGNLFFGHDQGGVSMYDGITFHTLLRDTLGSRVVAITEDMAHNIWVATQSKGLIFIHKNRSIISELLPEGLQGRIINTLYAHGDLLWVGTQEGLLFFKIEENILTPLPANILPPYTEVTSILQHRVDPALCWVGTAFNGVYLLNHDSNSGAISIRRQVQLPDLSSDVVQSIAQDSEGDLWVGTRRHGVLYLNIGRDRRTIHRVSTFSKATGFLMQSVNKLIVDQQGQVWASTMGDGLIRIYKEYFTYFAFAEKYGVTDVRAIVEANSGYLVATDKGLLKISFDRQSDEYRVEEERAFKNEPVTSLYTDSKGIVWIGTDEKGVFRLQSDGKSMQAIKIDPENEPIKVRLFEEDIYQNIWISAVGQGVYELDKDGKVVDHLTTTNRFIHNDIFAIEADSKGNIWFGAYGAGLAILNTEGELDLVSREDLLPSRDINDIDEDADGNIWIATEGDGFLVYKDGMFTQVGTQENLLTPFIKGIEYDPRGRIWYSYRKGLGYYDLKSQKRRHYGEADGLVPGEAYASMILVDSKTNKWFCNDYGVTLFESDTVRDSRKPLQTYLTGIKVFFKNYPSHLQDDKALDRSMVKQLPSLKLTHEENHLTFNFAAIQLNQGGKIYYRHLLQQYDEEWTPPSNSTSITYTNLDPGKYVLKIQATDDLSSWVDPITEYAFTIKPPYWKETWFYLLQIVCVLTLFALTYFIGEKALSTKRYVVRIMLFASFFITLEYVENFVDPLASDYFGGAPVFRFLLNFVLALLLLPVEAIITHRFLSKEKKVLDVPSSLSVLPDEFEEEPMHEAPLKEDQ